MWKYAALSLVILHLVSSDQLRRCPCSPFVLMTPLVAKAVRPVQTRATAEAEKISSIASNVSDLIGTALPCPPGRHSFLLFRC